MYYHQVHATVTLNTTLHDFENDSQGVRSSLVSGVANAAGVVPAQVHIHYVVIRLNHRRRRRRRLLSYSAQIQVSLVVSGAGSQSLFGLRRHLSSLQTARDMWEVVRRLLVVPIPPGHVPLSDRLLMAVEQNT